MRLRRLSFSLLHGRATACSSRQPANPKFEIFPEGQREYFLKVVDAQITFDPDAEGKATGLVLHQNGRNMPAKADRG